MKKTFIAFVLLFAMVAPSFAQVEEEIMQSRMVRIEQGRKYLIEKVYEHDYDKVKEIKDYLLSLENSNCIALKEDELGKVLLMTNEFDELVAYLSKYIPYYEKNKLMPDDDGLSAKLNWRCSEEENLIFFNLLRTDLPNVDKDFLKLYLMRTLHFNNLEIRESCNREAEKFLKNYPNSDYDWFVRTLICTKFKCADWGCGWSLNLCSGFVTGPLSKKMPSHFGGGLGFEGNYKLIGLGIGFDGFTGRVSYYADLDVSAFENNSIRLIPFVGVAFNRYYSDAGIELKNYNESCMTYRAGVVFDVKFPSRTSAVRLKYSCGLANVGQDKSSTLNTLSIGIAFYLKDRRSAISNLKNNK